MGSPGGGPVGEKVRWNLHGAYCAKRSSACTKTGAQCPQCGASCTKKGALRPQLRLRNAARFEGQPVEVRLFDVTGRELLRRDFQ
jgi:hypothetical protein